VDLKSELRRLKELHQANLKLAELKQLLTSSDLLNELNERNKEIVETKNLMDQTEKDVRDLQIKEDLIEQRLSQLKKQSQLVENYLDVTKSIRSKEYDALSDEANLIRVELDQIENKGIEILDEISKKMELVHQFRQKLIELEENKAVLERQISQIKSNLEPQIQKQQDLVEEIKHRLSPASLDTYNSILKTNFFGAVAEVSQGACQSCHVMLSSSTLKELEDLKTVVFCDECGAILIQE
jgi:predicted  nucleic acid-binding Zn-ribbon protein